MEDLAFLTQSSHHKCNSLKQLVYFVLTRKTIIEGGTLGREFNRAILDIIENIVEHQGERFACLDLESRIRPG